jgi:hypothetical protein
LKLQIAKDLSLPIGAVTQTIAILGVRGSGKTNTGVVLAEQLLTAKQQVVILDPVDVWWGLKSSQDGKRPGFSIPVVGGEHADVPLDAAGGTVLADFAVDNRASIILALRHLSMNDQRKFATDFAKRLYERKGVAEHRSPLMLIVDEADEFVPQRLPHGHEAMFGAFDRLVRRGRSSGIGVTLISQRAQVINKDVLSQMETLIGMRMLHKLDREALKAWIEAHNTEGRQEEFMASLASLGRGDAWVWSPEWLGVFQRTHILQRETFDSSATPKAGEHVAPPKEIAPVNLERLKERMAATIERAKADDPRELRKRIAELERGAARSPAPTKPDPAAHKEALERATERATLQTAGQLAKQFRAIVVPVRKAMLKAVVTLRTVAAELEAAVPPESIDLKATVDLPEPDPPAARHASPRVEPYQRPARPAPRQSAGDGEPGALTGPEQRILDAIAWMESIGVDAPEQTAVAFLAGYTYGGGAFNNPRGSLRTKGLVLYTGDCIALTDAGRKEANFPGEVLDSKELQRRVLDRLPGPERRILEVILAKYPEPMGNEECAIAAGYTPGGGAFNNPRGRLRTLGLIEYPQSGQVRARDLLFLK